MVKSGRGTHSARATGSGRSVPNWTFLALHFFHTMALVVWVAPAAAGLGLAALLLAACTIEVEEEGDADVQGSVVRMLEESADAWNRGELDGFMDDYLESVNTTYIGGTGLLSGYESIRARYAPLFEPGATRDSLRFEHVRVRRLAAIEAVLITTLAAPRISPSLPRWRPSRATPGGSIRRSFQTMRRSSAK